MLLRLRPKVSAPRIGDQEGRWSCPLSKEKTMNIDLVFPTNDNSSWQQDIFNNEMVAIRPLGDSFTDWVVWARHVGQMRGNLALIDKKASIIFFVHRVTEEAWLLMVNEGPNGEGWMMLLTETAKELNEENFPIGEVEDIYGLLAASTNPDYPHRAAVWHSFVAKRDEWKKNGGEVVHG